VLIFFTVVVVPCFGLLPGFVIPRTDSWYTGTSGTSEVRAREGKGCVCCALLFRSGLCSALVPETTVPFV
jgi:hypothetical protein